MESKEVTALMLIHYESQGYEFIKRSVDGSLVVYKPNISGKLYNGKVIRNLKLLENFNRGYSYRLSSIIEDLITVKEKPCSNEEECFKANIREAVPSGSKSTKEEKTEPKKSGDVKMLETLISNLKDLYFNRNIPYLYKMDELYCPIFDNGECYSPSIDILYKGVKEANKFIDPVFKELFDGSKQQCILISDIIICLQQKLLEGINHEHE